MRALFDLPMTQFLLGTLNDGMNIPGIIALKYTLQIRINSLTYCSYRKIDLLLTGSELSPLGRTGLWRDDGKNAVIQWYADERTFRLEDGTTDLEALLTIILRALEELWRKKGWPVDDLAEMHRIIVREQFYVSMTYGLVRASPVKKHRAELYCQLYPSHTDYFVRFRGKNSPARKVHFLKGQEDPEILYEFFRHRTWKDDESLVISDWNQEIFFIFNIQKDDFTLEFRPTYHSLEVCMDKLRSFGAGLTPDERLGLFGLPC